MSEPAVGLLLERLLSPPPRVRWEVARSIAGLIRSGDAVAAAALLRWIGKRHLESEVTLGLGVIQAFDLGAHFDAAAVEAEVRAPSFLSDWMMANAFPERRRKPRPPLPFAPDGRPALPHGQEDWFDRYRTWAVAPALSHQFGRLEAANGLPFTERWNHEWAWLQSRYPAPAAEYPWSYSEGVRERRGQFDLGQREIYASAFLRTLAYAVARWKMPVAIAESYSRLVLTFNRGLADLEPVARPAWSAGLAERGVDAFADIAHLVRTAAEEMVGPDEALIAVRVADITDNATVELDLRLVVATAPITLRPDDVAELNALSPRARPGELAGPLAEGAEGHQFQFDEPCVLAQQLWPTDVGRAHTEVIPMIRLASPYMFGRQVVVAGTANDIRLLTQDGVFSRWVHWYAEWDTTQPLIVDSCVGGVTTVRANALKRLIESSALNSAWVVSATFGSRSESFRDFESETRSAWLAERS